MPKKLSGYSVRTEGRTVIHRMYDTDVVVDKGTEVTFRHDGWVTPMTCKCIIKAGFMANVVGQKRKETSRFGQRKPTGGDIYVIVDGERHKISADGTTVIRKEAK